MTVETASSIRIQRSANCAIVAPCGTSGRIASTAVERHVIGHAREGLAHVEGLAMAVEGAMVVGGKGAVGGHLAGQHPAGERDADDDRHALRPSLREEQRSAGRWRKML